MDNELFLRHLCDLSLEDGRIYLQEHSAEWSDHAGIGNLIKDEALRQQNISPIISLKLGELLIFFGEYVRHAPSRALGLIAKGDAFRCMGQHQLALQYLDEAAQEFQRLGDEIGWARTRIGWIFSAAWLGRTEEALKEATRAREVFLRHGEYARACTVDNNVAVIYTRLARYQDALAIYERLRATYPAITGVSESYIRRSIAMAESNQASNLFLLGDFKAARQLMQQALENFIALGEPRFFIYTEMNLAEYDYAQGYYGSALRRYYAARDSAIQNDLDDSVLLAELKVFMAECLVKLNRAAEASQLVSESITTYRASGMSLDTAEALCTYATALKASHRLSEAFIALDEASRLYARGKFESYAYRTRLQQAELLLEMGSFIEAYNSAQTLKRRFDTQRLVPRSVQAALVMVNALLGILQSKERFPENIGLRTTTQEDILPTAGLLAKATTLCRQAALQAHRHSLQESVYQSQYLLGRIALLQGNSVKASRHYSAAISQLERILNDLVSDLSPSFLHTAWTVYADMIALCLQQSEAERAFSYLEQARSVALRQYLNRGWDFSEPDERLCRDSGWSLSSSGAAGQGPAAVPTGERNVGSIQAAHTNNAMLLRLQHELKDWQESYRDYSNMLENVEASDSPVIKREDIEREICRCEAKINELFERLSLHQSESLPGGSRGVPLRSPPERAMQPQKGARHKRQQVSVSRLRQSLAPDQLMLAYFLHQGKLVIFALTKGGLTTFENPGGVEQLERLIPLLHAHLQPGGWPSIDSPPQQVIRRLLRKLYDLLIAPVEERLPSPAGFLTIIPYGPLHKLPFHALYNGSRFLIEDYQMHYLPASNMLRQLKAPDNNATRDRAASSHSDPRGSGAGAKERAGRPLVFGYSANGHLRRTLEEAETLASMLGGRCYLEREATIAWLIEQAPGSPIIHLATHGQSRLDAPNFSFVLLADGKLNAIDAFGLDLRGCELVTLSGCETGLALTGGGDEQIGLGRAFLAAGASSLVMSLWQVEDSATSELMQRFYARLLQGDTKVQALRAAQCSLLHGSRQAHAHPYFWAAFRLVGDTGSLSPDVFANAGKDVVLSVSNR
ncbi:MAG TPA: CHAT domain-containing tetratricopeptide repeat protein [Ktedonobacteraceae bacterium]|nr:CHAT domain-containing tetratricopeptide repeat protein [Ktedonobacteraceae bacterium]